MKYWQHAFAFFFTVFFVYSIDILAYYQVLLLSCAITPILAAIIALASVVMKSNNSRSVTSNASVDVFLSDQNKGSDVTPEMHLLSCASMFVAYSLIYTFIFFTFSYFDLNYRILALPAGLFGVCIYMLFTVKKTICLHLKNNI